MQQGKYTYVVGILLGVSLLVCLGFRVVGLLWGRREAMEGRLRMRRKAGIEAKNAEKWRRTEVEANNEREAILAT